MSDVIRVTEHCYVKCHGQVRALRPGDFRCGACRDITRDEYLAGEFNRFRDEMHAALDSIGRAMLA